MHSLKEGEDQKEISIEPAQALDEVEPLPEDCYSRPISLTEGVCAQASHTSADHLSSELRRHWSFHVSSQLRRSASGFSSPISSPRGRPSSTPDTNTSWWSARCAAGWATFQYPAGEKYRSRVDVTPAITSFLSLFSPAEMWAQPEQAGV